ncbi:peptide chain release factor N(5)-glutamine methyltransferase [Porticoccaceae bacterium]|jgi:release factor glutamine methyltransferase|nr:peptide chain release factor N(5)-glutamine methyltransferase [Porticoccaceae bacterium]
MTIAELFQSAVGANRLSDSPELDCQLLLCFVLGVDSSYLKTWPERQVSDDQSTQFNRLFQRRLDGEPLAYLIGSQGFWSLDLEVSPVTLIPRPETELLVEVALDLALPAQALVLDLGTGTGAIALALATERSRWKICAVDLQQQTVDLAERNRQRYQLDNVRLFASNWFTAIPAQRFDLIVSNPPYIEANDPHLSQGDLRFEPASALVSGDDGLDDLRLVCTQSVDYLNRGGWLLLEHGFDQGAAVRELLEQAGFALVETRRDLNGLERLTLACRSD